MTTRRSKDIGTDAERAVARYLEANGWPNAERRALRGTYDCGDITGCPGLVFEVKGGQAAKTASDGQVEAWLAETERERVNAKADVGVLVLQRAGVGPANAGRWWAIVPFWALGIVGAGATSYGETQPVRMLLADMCALLRAAGYGDPVVEAAIPVSACE